MSKQKQKKDDKSKKRQRITPKIRRIPVTRPSEEQVIAIPVKIYA